MKKFSATTTTRSISIYLWMLSIIIVLMKFISLSLWEGGYSGRFTLFALPTAISSLYHGKSPNYTMYNDVRRRAFNYHYNLYDSSFSIPLNKLIVELKKPVQDRNTAYWGYDDRGLADFIKLSFIFFGPKESSLFISYFLILIGSSLVFFLHYKHRPNLSIISSLALIAISTAFVGYKYHQTPVTILHERSFGLLSLIPAAHLAVHTLAGRTTRRDIVFLALQSLIFVFIYHCRSSNAWQTLGVVAAGTAAWWIYAFAGSGKEGTLLGHFFSRESILAAFLPSLILIITFLGLTLYQRAAFASQYFNEFGSRNFYHNALMGLAGSKPGKEWKLEISDAAVGKAITRFLAEKNGVTAREENWRENWSVVFGRQYERDARKLYFHIWKNHPADLLKLYLIQKPLSSLNLIRLTTKNAVEKGKLSGRLVNIDSEMVKIDDSSSQKVLDLGYYYKIFGLPQIAAIALAFIVLVSAGARAVIPLSYLVAIAALFFVLSLIPSVLFYNQDLRQLTVSLACLSFFAYALVLWALVGAWSLANRIAAQWGGAGSHLAESPGASSLHAEISAMQPGKPGLTICIPAYNEEKALPKTVKSVLAAAETALPGQFEILVVNDGSTDGTKAAAESVARCDKRVRALNQPENKGVGAAFKRALAEAAYDRISLIPGDNAYDQAGIERLFRNTQAADLVISFRENKRGRPLIRRILSTVFSAWLRLMTGLPLRDGHSLYVFPVNAARALASMMPDDHRYHVVTLVHLLTETQSYVQVPVPLLPRADFSSSVLRPSFLVKIGLTMSGLFAHAIMSGVPFRHHHGIEVPAVS